MIVVDVIARPAGRVAAVAKHALGMIAVLGTAPYRTWAASHRSAVSPAPMSMNSVSASTKHTEYTVSPRREDPLKVLGLDPWLSTWPQVTRSCTILGAGSV